MRQNKLSPETAWLFERIAAQLPSPNKLAQAISAVLDVKLNNIYKRIRGEVALSAQEMILLLKHFDISLGELEQLSSGQLSIGARRPQFIYNDEMLTNYLDLTLSEMKQTIGIKHELYYAASDIPLFYYFYSEMLSRFKQLVWMRDANYIPHKDLKLKDIQLATIKKSTELFNAHEKLTTREFWTANTMTNLWLQIKFHFSQGILSLSEAELICNDASAFIDYLENAISKKNTLKQIYLCNYLPMSNSSLITTEVGAKSFVSFAGINYLTSTNISLAKDLQRWFENQKNTAILLNDNPIQRERFFNILRGQNTALLQELANNA